MEDLAKAAHDLETNVIKAVNDSCLPAALVEYILRNILMQIQSLEHAQAPEAPNKAEDKATE